MKIRTKSKAVFISFAISPLLFLGAVLTWQVFHVQLKQTLELQHEIVYRASMQISHFFDELKGELQLTNPNYKDLTSEQQYNSLSFILFNKNHFEDLTLLDSQGQERVRVSRTEFVTFKNLQDRSKNHEFLIPIQGQVFFAPIRFEKNTGEPFMKMAIPIYDAINRKTINYILVADVRLKKIWDVIAEIRIGTNGHAYAVDRDDRIVAHRNPSDVLRGMNFNVPSDGINTGQSNTLVVLASIMIPLGSQSLNIVAERPFREAFALAIQTTLIILILLVVVLVIVGSISVHVVRQITDPIEKLIDAAKSISKGDFSYKLDTSEIKDDELAILANAFDSMSTQLQNMIKTLEMNIEELTLSQSYVENIIQSMADSLVVINPDTTYAQLIRQPLRYYPMTSMSS